MTNASKAALMSGLLFPGLGQISIHKRTVRGLLFAVPAACALAYLLSGALALADDLANQIAAGTLPLDVPLIIEKIETAGAAGAGSNIAAAILIAAWLGSIIDALLTRP